MTQRAYYHNRPREYLRGCAWLILGVLAAGVVFGIAASAPRLFACFKSNKASADVASKKQCLKHGGRWLPKGDDMPIPGTRA